MNRVIDENSRHNDNVKAGFHAIIAAEGGWEKDGTTYAGITKGTLNDLINTGYANGIKSRYGKNVDPVALTKEDILEAYENYFDDALKGAARGYNQRKEEGEPARKGSDMLSDIGDAEITAAVMDTLFRNGPDYGAKYIQNAINATLPNDSKIDVKGGVGSETFLNLKDVAMDHKRHSVFLDTLYKQRETFRGNQPGDSIRNDYYRFK